MQPCHIDSIYEFWPKFIEFLDESDRGVSLRDSIMQIVRKGKTYNHVAGILLSQIIFWFSPSGKKKSEKLRIRIFKDDRFWIAKSIKEWEKETWITKEDFSQTIKMLKEIGLIVEKNFHSTSTSIPHISLNLTNFVNAYLKYSETENKDLYALLINNE